MARVLAQILRDCGKLSVAVLSLDDLYISREARARLSSAVHPLLATRGVPGTHDVELGLRVVRELLSAAPTACTRIPRFDKLTDEPRPDSAATSFTGRADIVIFEGWCVGARPQDTAQLAAPVNALERDADGDGRWRRYVNEQLAGRYQQLFSMIDLLVMLRAPRFESVTAWRQQQERELAATGADTGGGSLTLRIMTADDIERFVRHFERLTRHMLVEMPARADLVVDLDDDRKILNLKISRALATPPPGS
jgi:D-glycerate 3-kinase